MTSRRAAAAVCLLFARPLVADGGRAAEVAAWLSGTFELKDQGSDGAAESVRIVMVAVPKSRISNGALVLYREQAAAPKLDEPSQQRFYRLEEDGAAVRLRAFDPKDPILVRGKWRDPSALALYGASDVRERPGCAMLLRKKGDLWEGETPGTDCPSTVKSAATMKSVLILAQDGFTQWDRGFDEKARQTWKSPEAGMRFLKRSMSAPVDDKLIERPVGRRGEAGRRSGAVPVAGADGQDSSKVSEAEVEASEALTIRSPSSPSKKYGLTELRAMAGSGTLPLSKLVSTSGTYEAAATVVVVTSRAGGAAVFSSCGDFLFFLRRPVSRRLVERAAPRRARRPRSRRRRLDRAPDPRARKVARRDLSRYFHSASTPAGSASDFSRSAESWAMSPSDSSLPKAGIPVLRIPRFTIQKTSASV